MQVHNIRGGEVDKKWWIRWVFLVVIWLLTASMVRDLWLSRRGFDRIKESESRLRLVKEERDRLGLKFAEVSSAEHKEKLIREKLNMQKPDEVVVVLAQNNNKVIGLEDDKKTIKNWEKWVKTIFYRQ